MVTIQAYDNNSHAFTVPAEIDNATSSGDVITREFETVTLQCVATGIPEPTINWYRMTSHTNQIKERK